MTKPIEDTLLAFYWKRNRWQWENYFTGQKHDLNLLDQELYVVLSSLDLNQIDNPWTRKVAIRYLVDLHPEVSALKNKLDDGNSYKIRGKDNARLALSQRMRSDVLELMQLRDTLARQVGFSGYVQLVLDYEGLASKRYPEQIATYLQHNLNAARQLMATYDLNQVSWFKQLAKIGGHVSFTASNLQAVLQNSFGIDVKHSFAIEQGDRFFMALETGEGQIRVRVAPLKNLYQAITYGHELGHALAHKLNTKKGVERIFGGCYDETCACIMEYYLAKQCFTPEQQVAFTQIKLLENVRCALSALFEYELWQDPERAEDLYLKHYSKIFSHVEPALWSIDSFRSIDPVYIQNYLLGDLYAQQLFNSYPSLAEAQKAILTIYKRGQLL